MAITAGDTLSLNALGSATGQATKSLSAAKGDTNGPISMTSFGIDGVDSLSGYTYAVENTNETYTLGLLETLVQTFQELVQEQVTLLGQFRVVLLLV